MAKTSKTNGKKQKASGSAGVTAAAIGRHLDISRQRVGQFQAEGIFSKLPNGRFDLDDCRLRYIRWLRDDQRRSSKAASAARLHDARTREVEQRTALNAGALCETQEALGFIDATLGSLKADFIGLPARVTRDLAFRNRIEAEIDDIFRRAADRAEQEGKLLSSQGDGASATGEDNA